MGSLGLSLGCVLRLERKGAPPPPMAGISALEILGPEALPDGADAAVPNGWVARAMLPDDGVSAFDPTKIVLTVSDPGFDPSGAAVMRQRSIAGTAVLRRQWPNQAQRLNVASGGVRTVYFALSEEVFAGTAIVSAQAATGYYGEAVAGAVGVTANASTLPYPKPMLGWLNPQHERATGAGFAVEAVAYHRFARAGQQVACIEFTGRDAQATPNLSLVQRVSQPSLSDMQSGGQRVEAWKAVIPLAALTQGDLAQVNAVVKPWIGVAFDTAVNGAGTLTAGSAVDTAAPHTPLRFCCDKTGTYGGLLAYVRAGASGGAVGSSATPFPTIAAALTALAAANNGGKGHNDHSGSTIYLMDDGAGNGVDHVLGATATAAGKCWTDIRVDPAATAPAGTVRIVLSGLVGTTDLLRFHVPSHRNTAGNVALDGGSSANVKRIAFEAGCADTVGAAQPALGLTYRFGLAYWRNVSFATVPSPLFTFSTNRNAAALVLGCTGTFSNVNDVVTPYVCVGNRLLGARVAEIPSTHASGFGYDGGIVANNLFLKQPNSNQMGESRAIDGFARVQNVFETATGFLAGVQAWKIGGDGTLSAIANFVSMHNSVPGVGIGGANQARQNQCYTDVQNAGTGGSAAGISKQMVEMFDLLHQRNCKSDTFASGSQGGTATNTGRTGNWLGRYGVGHLGTVVVTGDASGGISADASGANWLGEVLPPSCIFAAGETNVTFADNRSGPGGAGSGSYALSGAANAAYGRVPAGRSVLAFDLAGVTRRSDGSGAAGAYERTIG
jgi:hypothetical protein